MVSPESIGHHAHSAEAWDIKPSDLHGSSSFEPAAIPESRLSSAGPGNMVYTEEAELSSLQVVENWEELSDEHDEAMETGPSADSDSCIVTQQSSGGGGLCP